MDFVLSLLIIVCYLFWYCLEIVLMISAGAVSLIFSVVEGLYYAITVYVSGITESLSISYYCEQDDEPAYRLFFTGPCFSYIGDILSDSFWSVSIKCKEIVNMTEDDIGGISLSDFSESIMTVWVIFRRIGCIIVVATLGRAIPLIIWLYHFILFGLIYVLLLIFNVLFSLYDSIYIYLKGIQSICSKCTNKFRKPFFVCPKCNVTHKYLWPGKYGFFKHKCKECGTKIPSMQVTGREKIGAICPYCSTSLSPSNSKPLLIQIIGGNVPNRRSFVENEIDALKVSIGVCGNSTYSIVPDKHEYMFSSVMINGCNTPRRIILADVAEELMLTGDLPVGTEQQKQFWYCDGFVFLVNLFGNSDIRDLCEKQVANFLFYLRCVDKRRIDKRNKTPLSIVMLYNSTCDKSFVPRNKFDNFLKKYEEIINDSISRDNICREFLNEIGLTYSINNLEMIFPEIHFGVINTDTTNYEGHINAIKWMIKSKDKKFPIF